MKTYIKKLIFNKKNLNFYGTRSQTVTEILISVNMIT
jgi:hypothetical protein